MSIVQCPGNRGQKVAALCHAQSSATLEKLCQAIAVDQFHGDIGAAFASGVPHLKCLNDMRVPQSGDSASLLPKTAVHRGISAGQQNLERNQAFLDLIVGLIYARRTTAPQPFPYQIPSDLVVGQMRARRLWEFCPYVNRLRGQVLAP